MFDWTVNGIGGLQDAALLILRVLLGGFFVLARFRWVYDPAAGACATPWANSTRWFSMKRHMSLEHKLAYCGYGDSAVIAGCVALIELLCGLGVLFGVLFGLAALGLLCILVFAMLCMSKEKVLKQNPVDCIECATDFLWTVEPLYFGMALFLLLVGPGLYTLDRLLP